MLESAVVVAALSVVVVFVTWPVASHFRSWILGAGGDATGTIAWLRSLADGVGFPVTGTTEIEDTGAPFGWEYGNGVNIQWAFVFFPAYLATEAVGAIAAYNAVIVSGLVLSGAAMYWLVRRVGGGTLAAAWAALVFTVFPWHLEKAEGHATLVHLEGFPLLVFAVLAWHERPTTARALLIAGATAVLWTTAGYYGVMSLVALAVLLPLAVIAQKRGGARRAFRRAALPAAASLLVAFGVYLVGVVGSTGEGVGASRSAGELYTYGARPWEFVVPSYRNPIIGDEARGWLTRHLHGSNFSESSLYVGWITIALAAGWLLWAFRKRRSLSRGLGFATVGLAVLTATALVFSLPSPLPRTDVSMPSRLLWELTPQFRVPARFIALVMTGMVPLAALALNEVLQAVVRSRSRRFLAHGAAMTIAALVAFASFLELWGSPQTTTTRLDVVPPEYQAVRGAPPGLLAEYPLASSDQGITSDYLFWQYLHGRPLVNGAPLGSFGDAVRQTLIDPATPGTPQALSMLGVSTIVLRPNVYAYTGGSPAPRSLRRGFRLLARTSGGASVWQVVARPAPAIAAFASGFGPAETPPGQPTSRWLTAKEGVVTFYTRRPGRYIARFAVSSYARPRVLRLRQGGSSFVREVTTQTLAVPIVLPRGRSAISVATDPGPERIPDGREVSVYVSNWVLTRAGVRQRPAPVAAAAVRPGDNER